MNLAAILAGHAAARPDHPAVEADGSILTYAQAVRTMLGFAAGLKAAGIEAGDRVGLALRDTPDHLLLHYAVAWLGATIVPVDHRWTAPEAAAIVRAFGCRLTLVDDDWDDRAGFAALRVDPAWADRSGGAPAAVDRGDLPVVLSLSSGTTGRPTGALVSHRQLYERFVSQWVGLGFNASDRYLLATPLYFGGGRSFAMSFLAAGATVLFRPPPVPPLDLIAAARDARATVTFLVPTQLGRLAEAWSGDGPAFPGLRRLVVSGAALPAELRSRAIARLSPGLTDYYATSEGGGIAVLHPDEQLAYAASVGRPIFRVEIEVVDDAGVERPRGVPGHLRYRGPGVSTQLVDADGSVTPAHPDGWFVPGDLACVTSAGHVELTGRAKDVIIRGGVNVYPAEIEAVLATHPSVLEAAVFPVADRDLGEDLAAAIVLRPGAGLSAEAVRLHAGSRLAPYKVPRLVVFTDALPRNTGGKLIRSELPLLLAPDQAELLQVAAP